MSVESTVKETPKQLNPARQIDLRRAFRLGLLGGTGAAYVATIGMLERFSGREIASGLTLGYLILFVFIPVVAYVASERPRQIEGFAPTPVGPRALFSGVLSGIGAGGVMGLYLLIIGTLDLRGIFTNISPRLIELLSFGRSVGFGIAVLIAISTVLGLLAGALQLLPDRWRGAVLSAFAWILLFGLLQSLVAGIFRGLGVPNLTSTIYSRGLGLNFVGTTVIGIVGLGLNVFKSSRRRPLRRRLEAMPARRRQVTLTAAFVLLLVFLAVLPGILGPFLTEVLNLTGIFLIMALGLNIVVGFAGLLDLGYVAFFAVGAYTVAKVTSGSAPGARPELIFWEAIPFVIVAAAMAGLIVGTPVLRMRGDYLAIVTLGFGEIARLLFLSDALKGQFGGAQGIINIPDIFIGPIQIRSPADFFYMIFLFVILAAYVSWALQDSRIGRAWMAMREDEDVAEAMGVNIVNAKLWAFVIGAILASFAGALFGVKIGSVFPHSFAIIVSITVLVIVIVGGIASIPGVILGAFVLIGLPELLREFEQFKLLIYGALLIFMMLKRPEGFIPSRRRAQELHEDELFQDAWLREREEERKTMATET